MRQCDMVCIKCLFAHDYSNNEENEMGIVCKSDPTWKLISETKIDNEFPDIDDDPNYHTCGHGKWVDENGEIIGYLDAEDIL